MATSNVAQFPGIKMNPVLADYVQRIQEMVRKCRILIEYDTVEDRRKLYLRYGQLLSEIRNTSQFKDNDRAFGAFVRMHQLDVSTPAFRSDAIWMAESWSTLLASIKDCPYANPMDVRQWHGEQQGTRKPIKRRAANKPVVVASSDDKELPSDDEIVEKYGIDPDEFYLEGCSSPINIMRNVLAKYKEFAHGANTFAKMFDAKLLETDERLVKLKEQIDGIWLDITLKVSKHMPCNCKYRKR